MLCAPRWFAFDPATKSVAYYEKEGRMGKPKGEIILKGAKCARARARAASIFARDSVVVAAAAAATVVTAVAMPLPLLAMLPRPHALAHVVLSLHPRAQADAWWPGGVGTHPVPANAKSCSRGPLILLLRGGPAATFRVGLDWAGCTLR
jgi:hypothetical protein